MVENDFFFWTSKMLPFGVKLPVSFYTIHDEGSKFRVLEEMKILGFDFIMKILLHNFFFSIWKPPWSIFLCFSSKVGNGIVNISAILEFGNSHFTRTRSYFIFYKIVKHYWSKMNRKINNTGGRRFNFPNRYNGMQFFCIETIFLNLRSSYCLEVLQMCHILGNFFAMLYSLQTCESVFNRVDRNIALSQNFSRLVGWIKNTFPCFQLLCYVNILHASFILQIIMKIFPIEYIIDQNINVSCTFFGSLQKHFVPIITDAFFPICSWSCLKLTCYISEHDDRTNNSENHIRKVSFKNNYGRIGKKKTFGEVGVRRLRMYDDVEMSNGEPSGQRKGL